MRILTQLLCGTLFLFSAATAQESKNVETTFTATGNCGMCKTRIEKTLKIKEVTYAKWDKITKQVKIAYNATAISVDSLQKRVALAGHDTELYSAPDAVYAKLPKCCLYRDNDNTH